MSDDTMSKIAKEFAKKLAEAKEAFIIEELKPYCNTEIYNGDYKVIWKQKVRLRLAEYKDWKRQFEQEKETIKQQLIKDFINTKDDICKCGGLSDVNIIALISKCFGVEK